MVGIFFAEGFLGRLIGGMSGQGAGFGVFTVLVLTPLILLWTHADAKQRGFTFSPLGRVCVGLASLIALPIYFFYSRSFFQALLSSILMVLWLLVLGAFVLLGSGLASVFTPSFDMPR